jgi:hypothetical protein
MTAGKSIITSTELLKQLESKDHAVVIKALSKLEKTANINDLPGIIKVMAGLTDLNLMNYFTEFLSNVKSKKAPAVMVQFLSDPAFANVRIELTRACWESQLDYSPYLILFARMFISSDFVLAIEAFTVIESTCQEQPANQTILKEISGLIKNSLPDQPETKQRLTRELIVLLNNYIAES